MPPLRDGARGTPGQPSGALACAAQIPVLTIAGLDPAQIAHARTIVSVGLRHGVPERGLVIALVAALQESSLRNLANPIYPESLRLTTEGTGTDHDSVGLFQQRPSMGWGRVEELMRPEIAAEKFYDALLAVPGWPTMDIAAAAQAVQVAAYPEAFDRHEELARLIVGVAGPATRAGCAPARSGAWVAPVSAPVVSGFRTAARPQHDGVDLGAPRGTPILAASAGVVVTAACDVSAGGCDRDGSTGIRGCGWYVEIEHAGGILTRYCHLLFRPEVEVGQQANPGQVIGRVGSSGHSSGPHLHFEVHQNDGRDSGSATDPVAWMADHGAPLG